MKQASFHAHGHQPQDGIPAKSFLTGQNKATAGIAATLEKKTKFNRVSHDNMINRTIYMILRIPFEKIL